MREPPLISINRLVIRRSPRTLALLEFEEQWKRVDSCLQHTSMSFGAAHYNSTMSILAVIESSQITTSTVHWEFCSAETQTVA